MTEDEMARLDRIERNMEFIVAQQAQFAADMQQIREVLHTHSEGMVGLVGMMGRIAEAHAALASRAAEHDTRMSVLEVRMADLAAAGKETEDRLSAFITFVEKYISSHNGDKGSQP